jgi:hypothetical protein
MDSMVKGGRPAKPGPCITQHVLCISSLWTRDTPSDNKLALCADGMANIGLACKLQAIDALQ